MEMEGLLMLDKARSSPYGMVVWICISSILHIFLFKSNVKNDYQAIQRVLMVFIAFVFALPIHELIHFVFMKIFYKGKVVIEYAKDPVGFPTLRTRALSQGEIANWQKIVVSLAPFVFLTLLLDVAFIFCSKVALLFFIVAVANSAGCYFDIIDALKILQNRH